MRIVILAAVVAACGAPPARPRAPTSKLQMKLREAGIERLVAVTRSGDATAMRALFGDSVTFGGAWFADPTCRTRLAVAGKILPPHYEVFARCLATLPLTASTRTSAHPEIALVSYAPGIELEVLFGGSVEAPKLRWIGYVARGPREGEVPTFTQAAFEALRVDPQPLVLDAATRARVDDELRDQKIKHLYSWFKVCADTQGTITHVQRSATSSIVAQRAFEAQLRTWKLQPVRLGAEPSAVCALIRAGDPPVDRDSDALPILLSRPHVLYLAQWISKQLAGERFLTPPDGEKFDIMRAGASPVLGIVQVCYDTRGHAESVAMLRSTGFAGYDRRLVTEIRKWQVQPVVVDGQAVPFCTTATFVYSQR